MSLNGTIVNKRKSRRYETRRKTRERNKVKHVHQDRIKQRTISICIKRFGIIADARHTVRQNIIQITEEIHPLNLPRRPNNLKVHNICYNPEAISKELLDTLGLNLGFGISMPPKKEKTPIDFERLRRSIRVKFIKFPDYDTKRTYNPKLYIRKENLTLDKAPRKIEKAINNFEEATKKAFQRSQKAKHVGNLDKTKIELLRTIRKERKYIIVAADKNLGPCILEIEQYINRCLNDHLDKKETYKELTELEAVILNENNFRWVCETFIDKPPKVLSEEDRKFFIDSIHGERDGLKRMHPKDCLGIPYFYAMPKMHKTPWALRPVVSGVSSVMESLSKWLDVQLQSVVHLCPCYLKDSWHFLNDIKDLKNLQGCKLISSDADAFYTNINTDHAIEILEKWFIYHKKDLAENFPQDLVLKGIKRLMENNVFTFGDRYFLQLNGTAMGTNVACMYATIYYSYHEETQLLHLSYIKFYRRLIDDAFIIFDDKKGSFADLEANMNDFGPINKRLHWTTEQPSNSIDFLDLTITINEDGTITTRTFQKTMNLYLYRTPDSCQPANILYSFVYGLIHRYYWQNTHEEDFLLMIERLFSRMLERGHIHKILSQVFISAIKKVETSSLPNPKPGTSTTQKTEDRNLLFIHLPHHPNNPMKHELRTLTTDLKNELKTAGLKLERIIIAFSKAPNIGDICKKHRLEGFIDTSYQKQL